MHRGETTTTALESILETDENQVKESHQKKLLQQHKQKQQAHLHKQEDQVTMDSQDNAIEARQHSQNQQKAKKKQQTSQQRKDGSNGSTTMSSNNFTQIKNTENEMSTMQTSGGFSNTRRSPREPSHESTQKRVGG